MAPSERKGPDPDESSQYMTDEDNELDVSVHLPSAVPKTKAVRYNLN